MVKKLRHKWTYREDIETYGKTRVVYAKCKNCHAKILETNVDTKRNSVWEYELEGEISKTLPPCRLSTTPSKMYAKLSTNAGGLLTIEVFNVPGMQGLMTGKVETDIGSLTLQKGPM